MLKIRYNKKASKYLQSLPPKHQRQVARRIEDLCREPEAPDTRELVGFDPLRRATAGEYRIIYAAIGDSLYVEIVGKRNDDDIYRKLRNKS